MARPSHLLETATSFHQAGRLAEAEKAYRKLLRAEPVNPDGLRLLGGLYMQTGQIDRAAECLEKATRVLPDHVETLTNLGVALRALGREEEALGYYDRALALNKDYQAALTNKASLFQESNRTTEALDLFGRALRLEPESAVAHFNYANILYVTGRSREAIERYEHALRIKPDYLDAMINLGMILSQIGKGEQSRQWLGLAKGWFEKALLADPTNTVALNNMGNILRQQGNPQEALDFYRKALELRPSYGQAMLNMATSLRDLNRDEEALDACRRSVDLMPTFSDAHINQGNFLQDLGRHEEAIHCFDRALSLKPESIDAKWNKSLSLLGMGEFERGWALHEVGLGIAHMRGEYPSVDKRWNGESFVGKRLLIWCEQGLGDSLQFIRYAKLCKERGGTVIVHCPRPLRALFKNCSFIDALPEICEEKDFDLHVPTMSLPFIFKTTLETIPCEMPYLYVGEAARERMGRHLTDKSGLRVGLVWSGNPRENQINANLIDRRRSMKLETMRALFDVENVQFYNLQMAPSSSQIDECGLRAKFIDLMPKVDNFEDTAAIVEHLDLVIAVDTSIVHLAGGLNKPVWVLSRFDACWRWLQNRRDSPWYPSARVFGQLSPGDWSGTIQNVKEALYEASMTTNA